MTQPYVYRLIDKDNGKLYIGVRYAKNCSPSDLGVSYFTSSKIVQPIFKANPARFEKQIIVCSDVDYVIKVEKTLLDIYNAVLSDEYYNRTDGKAFHPDDIRAGALKEHAKRSTELYASIARNMHLKTTREQRAKGAKNAYEKMTPDERIAKMAMMRGNKTEDSIARTRLASIQRAKENPQRMSEMGRIGGKIGGSLACKKTNVQLWRCIECGMVSKPGPLGKHQSRKGHFGKERVE